MTAQAITLVGGFLVTSAVSLYGLLRVIRADHRSKETRSRVGELERVNQIQKIQRDTIDYLEGRVKDLEAFRQVCLDGQAEFQKAKTAQEIEVMKLHAEMDKQAAYYDALDIQLKSVKQFQREQTAAILGGRRKDDPTPSTTLHIDAPEGVIMKPVKDKNDDPEPVHSDK